jgi:Ca2+-binding EF-hand superfamily protein
MKALSALIMALCVISAVPAFGAGAPKLDTTGTMGLSDRNGDQKIDREEYNQRMTEVFYFADVDKDGSLTIVELAAVEPVDPRAFQNADKDGNGKLSLGEFLYAVHIDFYTADTNRDGAIDMQELRLFMGK